MLQNFKITFPPLLISVFKNFIDYFTIVSVSTLHLGRALAQAVSRWLPTAAARVRVRAEHVGFVVDKVALGQVFSEYFGFTCQSSFIPPISPSS
jgi:hypothetical protein